MLSMRSLRSMMKAIHDTKRLYPLKKNISLVFSLSRYGVELE